jgi:hypothetical protein
MTPIVSLFAALLVSGDPPFSPDSGRPPNPLAPSLPQLTDKEEAHFDRVIDRFIDYDIGRLRGEEGKKALAEFKRLGPEATPALIRGINRAARIDGSCPAVTIAKKLSYFLKTTNDSELLEFARENIGAGVTESRHMNVLRDLRFTCSLRKRAIAQNPIAYRASPPPSGPRFLSIGELVNEAADTADSPQREELIKELERRPTKQLLSALAPVAADSDHDKTQQVARDVLVRCLNHLSPKAIKEKLKDDRAEVRAAAARVVGIKRLHHEAELIELVGGGDEEVRQAARQALFQLSGGSDFGPEPDADVAARAAAARKWRDWLAKQDGR